MALPLYDPLRWLVDHDIQAHLAPDGVVRLRFRRDVDYADRRRAMELLDAYAWLLRLQLDVPPGVRPRTVQQLVAAGRLKLADAPRAARG
ncbi:MAG TPA: hypothetical protein PKC79_09415 [Solidesulfovibrio magneticus]|nr:hypothetical protein [Solidesulfovibrio magneticus]